MNDRGMSYSWPSDRGKCEKMQFAQSYLESVMKKFTRNLNIATLFALAPLIAQAAEGSWGAVALDINSTGYAYGYASENAARQAAQSSCGTNCALVFAFNNSCGAIATGDKGGWGYGVGKSEDAARESANAHCRKQTTNCAVRVSACSMK